MRPKKIAIGSDHAGFESKEKAKDELLGLGVEVCDLRIGYRRIDCRKQNTRRAGSSLLE